MTPTPPDYSEELAGQARAWVVRLASRELGDRDMQAFAQWLQRSAGHRRAFEDERGLWQAMGQVESQVRAATPLADAGAGSAAAGARLPRHARRRHRFWAAGAAAAMLALVLVLPQQRWRWQADHHATHAIESVQLADGSEAVLDAGAAIRLSYDDQQRGVELLRGRAWFKVAHGDRRPFRVEARNGMTRDIGTAFEVALEPETVRTAVTEGEVELRSSGTVVRLRAGQSAHYRQGGAVSMPQTLPVASIASWREGDIVLEQQRPAVAIREIARYYPGRVLVYGDFGAQPVSGAFRTDKAGEAIRSIAALAGAEVRSLPGGWLLVSGNTPKK